MRRRPTEVYATALPYSTGELPVIRREPRVTPGVNPEQAIGNRGVGGSLGSSFTLPLYAAVDAGSPAIGRRESDRRAAPDLVSDGCG